MTAPPLFPKLWQAFADDAEVMHHLDRGLPFDDLFLISQQFGIGGNVASPLIRARLLVLGRRQDEQDRETLGRLKIAAVARHVARTIPTKWFRNLKPPFDISDFPDAPEKGNAVKDIGSFDPDNDNGDEP